MSNNFERGTGRDEDEGNISLGKDGIEVKTGTYQEHKF